MVAFAINTIKCITKVSKVRFMNFSKAFCFKSALYSESIYFFFAFICHIMFAIIQKIVYIDHETVV